MKKSEKQLASEGNFSNFLQLSCFKLSLKLCKRPKSHKKFCTKLSLKGSESSQKQKVV